MKSSIFYSVSDEIDPFSEPDDFQPMLQEIPSLKTFSIAHYRDGESNSLNHLWLNISIEDSSTDVLLPDLTSLIYCTVPFFEFEGDKRKEFALSRRGTSHHVGVILKTFIFMHPRSSSFLKTSPRILKTSFFPSMVATHATPDDPCHLSS